MCIVYTILEHHECDGSATHRPVPRAARLSTSGQWHRDPPGMNPCDTVIYLALPQAKRQHALGSQPQHKLPVSERQDGVR